MARVSNPVPDRPAASSYGPSPPVTLPARTLAGLVDRDERGLQLRKPAGPVGRDRAEQGMGLSDGGNGLENFVQKNVPRDVERLLDFWHASEYLLERAKRLHPDDEEARQQLHKKWCCVRKHEGGKAIIAHREQFPLPPRTPAARHKLSETLTYFMNNVHRMDYPTSLANGWLIGSGAVESACKTVVGQRLKRAGRGWREDGTDARCHLRALCKRERRQGNAFGQRSIN